MTENSILRKKMNEKIYFRPFWGFTFNGSVEVLSMFIKYISSKNIALHENGVFFFQFQDSILCIINILRK